MIHNKIHFISPGTPQPSIAPYSWESWPKTPFIAFHLLKNIRKTSLISSISPTLSFPNTNTNPLHLSVLVPVEDAASLREMAEYFSAAAAADGSREEMAPSNRPVTVIVYQNGDQVNFFRVVDRDATASPTAESLRWVDNDK